MEHESDGDDALGTTLIDLVGGWMSLKSEDEPRLSKL